MTYFIVRAYTQEPGVATANTGKTRERFRKNADEWTGRVEISKEEIPGSKREREGKRGYMKKVLVLLSL